MIATQPQGFFRIFKVALSNYGKSFMALLPLSVIWALLAMAYGYVLMTYEHLPRQTMTGTQVAVIAAALLIWALGSLVLHVSAANRANALITSQDMTTDVALKIGFRKFLGVLGINIILGILMILAAIPVVIGVAFKSQAQMLPHIGGIISLLIMTYLAISLFFSSFIYAIKDMGVFKSIGKSFELVRNNWWRTFLNLILLFIFYIIIAIVIGLIFGAIVGAIGYFMHMDNMAVIGLIHLFHPLLFGLVALVCIPLFYPMILLLLSDLHKRHNV